MASGRGRYGLITFDDGYRDNFEVAFPVLKSEGVAATFFISTGFIDLPRVPWWDEIASMVRTSRRDGIELPGWLPGPVLFDEPDRESAVRTLLRTYKSMPTSSTDSYIEAISDATGSGRCSIEQATRLWMDWAMLREMRAGGMTIGGHTVSHAILARALAISREKRSWGAANGWSRNSASQCDISAIRSVVEVHSTLLPRISYVRQGLSMRLAIMEAIDNSINGMTMISDV